MVPFIVILLSFILGACSGSGSSENIAPTNPAAPPSAQAPLFQNIMDLPISVTRLLLDGDAQLAATREGLYWRENTQANWQKRSPLDTEVTGVVVIGAGHYIVAIAPQNISDGLAYPLYSSINSGETWELIEHDFGREFNDVIYALAYDETNDNLYATNAVGLAVSNKNAQSWTLLSGFWDGIGDGLKFIRVDGINNNIWFGGQGAIENGIIAKYDRSSSILESWQRLLPNPSAYRGGLIHPTDMSTVMFSGEGGLIISTDNGATWNTPLGDVDFTFYFDVVIDASMTLYTAQWQSGNPEQNLVIQCSADNGLSWISNDLSNETDRGGALSLRLFEQDDNTLLYLGLEENGIKAVDVSQLNCG